MRRTDRDNAICFESLEEALAKSPETYGHIDLLCAGWPCQDYSIAGKRKGMQGEKGILWNEVARCLRIFKPKWFLGENVPGLLSVDDGRAISQVTSDIQKIGYGISWRTFDSQYFGLAQRRKRVFFVGCLGKICPPEILFEEESGFGDDKKKPAMGQRGLCLSTNDGRKQDARSETLIASTVRGQDNDQPQQRRKSFVAQCLSAHDFAGDIIAKGRKRNIIAQTIGATPRGNASFVWQDTHIAETNTNRKREAPRLSHKLDSRRGVVIGNAVSVNVAEYIAKRIYNYERKGD